MASNVRALRVTQSAELILLQQKLPQASAAEICHPHTSHVRQLLRCLLNTYTYGVQGADLFDIIMGKYNVTRRGDVG